MTSYDYFTEVGAEELENQNEEEACCLEVRALFAAQRGLKSNKKACSEANAAMNAAIGKISRLQRENRKLKDELERLKEAQPEEAQPEDEPQCLDADGVPIEVGDTVYYFDKKSGEPKAGFGPFRVIDYGPHAQAVLLRYEKGGVDGYGNYSESFEDGAVRRDESRVPVACRCSQGHADARHGHGDAKRHGVCDPKGMRARRSHRMRIPLDKG